MICVSCPTEYECAAVKCSTEGCEGTMMPGQKMCEACSERLKQCETCGEPLTLDNVRRYRGEEEA